MVLDNFTVANAFMFHHEKDTVECYSQYLKLYKRFIDDIFAILEFFNALRGGRWDFRFCGFDQCLARFFGFGT